MARIRSVHPDITEDETLVDVSDGAERTFVRLWTYLDDEGRGKDNVRLIKAQIYPLADDKTPEIVDAHLWELVEHGLLMRYEVDGKDILCAKPTAWANYQKPQRPKASKLPAPPADYTPPTPPAQNDPKDTEDASPRHESATRQRRDSDATATQPVRVHAVVEGRGRQERERETGARADASRHDTTRRDATRRDTLALVPTNSTAPPARTSAPTGTYPSDFEAWYAAYPRKRGKADAARAWKHARATAPWEQLIGGLERAITNWEREHTPPDKIPYPATWLHGRRWEDEPDTQLATTTRKPATNTDQISNVLARRQQRKTS